LPEGLFLFGENPQVSQMTQILKRAAEYRFGRPLFVW